MGNNLFKVTTAVLAVAVVAVAFWANKKIEELQAELQKARAGSKDALKLTECERTARDLRDEIKELKDKLAKAQATPPADGGPVVTEALDIEGRKRTGGGVGGQPVSPEALAEVNKVVRAHKPSIQACYERALKRNQDLHVRTLNLTLNFAIQPSGGAASVNVSPAVDSHFADCIQKTVSRWKFPKFSQVVPIPTPMNLRPRAN